MTTVASIARTPEQVLALRDVWDELSVPDPDADLDFFLSVVAADPTVIAPHVVCVSEDDQPPTLLVARVAEHKFQLRLGYLRVGRIRAKALLVSFGGLLGEADISRFQEVSKALTESLESSEVDVVVVQKVDTTSAWYRHLTVVSGTKARPPTEIYLTDLPESWSAMLAERTSKSRRQIRYDDNKLRRTYGERLVLRQLHLPENHQRLLGDIRRVAEASYQRGLGVSIVNDPLQLALLESARSQGWLRCWMLYLDGRPVAFWWGVVRRGVLTIGSPGFDPANAKDRVGYFTFKRMLEDACSDPEISRVNYGPGAADYKERFSTSKGEVADVLLYSKSIRSQAIRHLLGIQDFLIPRARRLLARHGHLVTLRRTWRQQLVSRRAQRDANVA